MIKLINEAAINLICTSFSEPLEHVLLAKMIKTNEFLVFDSIIVAILNIEVPYSNRYVTI